MWTLITATALAGDAISAAAPDQADKGAEVAGPVGRPTVCVMCGTRPGRHPRYTAAARQLGHLLAGAGLGIICGGARSGLMGALADGALAAGGQVEGVIPRELLDHGMGHPGLHRMRLVAGLAGQQDVMLRSADAFVVLPGGPGTLSELMMLITAAQIGLHSKPIVLLRDRYFIPVTEALEAAVADGFASWEDLRLVHVFPDVPAVVQALADWRDGLPGSPLTCAVAANGARGYELRQLVSSLTGGQPAAGREQAAPRGHDGVNGAPAWRPYGWPVPAGRGKGWPGRELQRVPAGQVTLHLVTGPTGCGKTARATSLARQSGAPVVVLDRLQCHRELAAGTGRPPAAETAGTRRIYLCDRPLSAGELPAREAHRLLASRVAQLAGEEARLIIVEGGSVSLLHQLYGEPAWREFPWSFERRPLPPAGEYLPAAAARAAGMLQPPGGSPGLLDELAQAWQTPAARPVLLSVFTYRLAIGAALDAGLPVRDAARLPPAGQASLTESLAAALHAHARWQEREITGLPPGWRRATPPAAYQAVAGAR